MTNPASDELIASIEAGLNDWQGRYGSNPSFPIANAHLRTILARLSAAENALAEAERRGAEDSFTGLTHLVQYRRHGSVGWNNMAAFDGELVAQRYAENCCEGGKAHWKYRSIPIRALEVKHG